MYAYFARHGESEANILKIFANETGAYGLTEKGRGQAEALAELLVPEGITRAYASPLMRAQQTAEIVCAKLGLPFETSLSLREFGVGNHEGSCDKSAWDEYGQVEKSWLIDGDTQARIGGGECYDDVEARFMPLLNKVVAEFANSEERILFIGHGGTFACMLPLLLTNIDKKFAQTHPLRPASLIVAQYCENHFTCLRWTDTVFEPSCAVDASASTPLGA